MRAACTALLLCAYLVTPAVAASETLRGEVLESQPAGEYTYLRLRTAQGDLWAAVPRVPVDRGAKVAIFGADEMRDFESRILGRTFDRIHFGVLGVDADEGVPTRGAANQPVVEPVGRADAPGAKTVAEIVSGREGLRGREVVVRARVDRVSRNVMGMNWVHLRDGSGTPAEGNYDLVATSEELPDVGAIVVARGTVLTDFDAGMGHTFRVLLEKASFR